MRHRADLDSELGFFFFFFKELFFYADVIFLFETQYVHSYSPIASDGIKNKYIFIKSNHLPSHRRVLSFYNQQTREMTGAGKT